MNPYLWLPLAALISFSGVAQSQPLTRSAPFPGHYSTVPRINPGDEAAATLRKGLDKLLEFLGQDEMPNKLQVAAFLDKDIAPYFDFDYMAKWVAGPRYSEMSPEQREALSSSLEARFLGTLASQLSKYDGQQVRFFRPRRGARGSVYVTVGVQRPGSYPSKLQFRMYRSGDDWKIYDVVANGRSAVAFYRQQSRREQTPGRYGPYGR